MMVFQKFELTTFCCLPLLFSCSSSSISAASLKNTRYQKKGKEPRLIPHWHLIDIKCCNIWLNITVAVSISWSSFVLNVKLSHTTIPFTNHWIVWPNWATTLLTSKEYSISSNVAPQSHFLVQVTASNCRPNLKNAPGIFVWFKCKFGWFRNCSELGTSSLLSKASGICRQRSVFHQVRNSRRHVFACTLCCSLLL